MVAKEKDAGRSSTAHSESAQPPSMGSGWPNVMLFDPSDAVTSTLAPRIKRTVRIHMEVTTESPDEYDALEKELVDASANAAAIRARLKSWLNTSKTAPNALVDGMTFDGSSSKVRTGKVVYDLFADHGPFPVKYGLSMHMDIQAGGNQKALFTAVKQALHQREWDILKPVLEGILQAQNCYTSENSALLNSIDGL